MNTFSLISAIATVLLLMLILLPGLIFDKWSVPDDEVADQDRQMVKQLVLSRLRCYVAVVPGSIAWAFVLFIQGLLADDQLQKPSWWWVPLSIVLVSVLLLVVWRLFALSKDYKQEWKDYTHVLRLPGGIIFTNIVSIIYLIFFASVAESEFLASSSDSGPHRTLLAYAMGMGFLVFVSIWPYNLDSRAVDGSSQKIWSAASLKWIFYTLFFLIVLIISYHPGLLPLLHYYLQATRLGGGTSAVLTIDSDVARVWPETFVDSGGPDGREKTFQSARNS